MSILFTPRFHIPNTVSDNAGLLNKYQVIKLTQKGCKISSVGQLNLIILNRPLFKNKTKLDIYRLPSESRNLSLSRLK